MIQPPPPPQPKRQPQRPPVTPPPLPAPYRGNATEYLGEGWPDIGANLPDSIKLGRFVEYESGEIQGRIHYPDNEHIVVFGMNGAGKSTRVLMTNLLSIRGRSILVMDTKGELAAATAEWRRSIGEKVVIINPYGVLMNNPTYADLKSEGYNPLYNLDPADTTFNERATDLAAAMVEIEEGRNAHFGHSARAMVAALIMYVVREAKKNGTVATLAEVRRLICQAHGQKERLPMEPIVMQGITAIAEQLIAENIEVEALKNKMTQFAKWSNEKESIASTAQQNTQFLDDPQIADDLGRGKFDFAEMHEHPVTVYLVLPPKQVWRHKKWLRMLITDAVNGVMKDPDPYSPRTLFMLDEFAALGRLEIVEQNWQMMRGYEVTMLLILQDLPLLERQYKESWRTFLGNCGVVITFTTNEMTTAEWFCKRSLDTTRVVLGENVNTGGGGPNGGKNWKQEKFTFLQPYDLFAVEKGFAWMMVSYLPEPVPIYLPWPTEIDTVAKRIRDTPFNKPKAQRIGS